MLRKIKPRYDYLFLVYVPAILIGIGVISVKPQITASLVPFITLFLGGLSIGGILKNFRALFSRDFKAASTVPSPEEETLFPKLSHRGKKNFIFFWLPVLWMLTTLQSAALQTNQNFSLAVHSTALQTLCFGLFIIFLIVLFYLKKIPHRPAFIDGMMHPALGRLIKTPLGWGTLLFKQMLISIIMLTFILNVIQVAQSFLGELPSTDVLSGHFATLVFVSIPFMMFSLPKNQQFLREQWKAGRSFYWILGGLIGILFLFACLGIGFQIQAVFPKIVIDLPLLQFLWWLGMAPFLAMMFPVKMARAVIFGIMAVFVVATLQSIFSAEIATFLLLPVIKVLLPLCSVITLIYCFQKNTVSQLFFRCTPAERRWRWSFVHSLLVMLVSMWGLYWLMGLGWLMRFLCALGVFCLIAFFLLLIRSIMPALTQYRITE